MNAEFWIEIIPTRRGWRWVVTERETYDSPHRRSWHGWAWGAYAALNAATDCRSQAMRKISNAKRSNPSLST